MEEDLFESRKSDDLFGPECTLDDLFPTFNPPTNNKQKENKDECQEDTKNS